jgi:hypothetical protein
MRTARSARNAPLGTAKANAGWRSGTLPTVASSRRHSRRKAMPTSTGLGQETDVRRGDYIDPNAGRVLLGDLGARWLRSRMVDPATAIRYETAYRLHVEPTFGRRRVRSIKPSEIAEWLADLGSQYTSTGRTALLALMGALDLAVADEAIKPGRKWWRVRRARPRRSSLGATRR